MVVGCGVIGMATALRLREAGWNVEVWTREDPRATTSAAAGAIWYPYLAEPRDAAAEVVHRVEALERATGDR